MRASFPLSSSRLRLFTLGLPVAQKFPSNEGDRLIAFQCRIMLKPRIGINLDGSVTGSAFAVTNPRRSFCGFERDGET